MSPNGYVAVGSVDHPTRYFGSFPLESYAGLAATFLDDHDTSSSGSVYYRQTVTDMALLELLSNDVRDYGLHTTFSAAFALMATWHRVAEYSGQCSTQLCVSFPSDLTPTPIKC